MNYIDRGIIFVFLEVYYQSMRKILFLLLFPVCVFSQSNFEKGETYFQQEKLTKAKSYLVEVGKEDSNYYKAQEYLADIAVYRENLEEALEIYEELVERFPANANLNFKYGGTLGLKALAVTKIEAAFYISDIKKYFKKAAELDKNHIEARWALVELYVKLPGFIGGSFETATTYADQLLEISPINGYFAKGYIAEHDNQPKISRTYYLKAMELNNAQACQQDLQNFSLHKIDNLDAEKMNIGCQYFNRNQLNYLTGKVAAEYNIQNQRGIFYLQQYIKNFSPVDNVPLHYAFYRKAQLYKNLGDKKQAEKWINKSLELENDFDKALEEKTLIQAM